MKNSTHSHLAKTLKVMQQEHDAHHRIVFPEMTLDDFFRYKRNILNNRFFRNSGEYFQVKNIQAGQKQFVYHCRILKQEIKNVQKGIYNPLPYIIAE